MAAKKFTVLQALNAKRAPDFAQEVHRTWPMAESKTPTVRFEQHTFAVARPEVLPLLREATAYDWGIFAMFHGTENELIAAGLATEDQFRDVGKSGQRNRPDGHGNRTMVKRRRGGKWDLSIWACGDPQYGDPDEASTRKGKWWLEHGAKVEAETNAILARLARHAP